MSVKLADQISADKKKWSSIPVQLRSKVSDTLLMSSGHLNSEKETFKKCPANFS